MMTPIHADGFERVALCRDEETGLRSVVVIHDTTLGPALGGVRMHAYPDEDAAVADGLRLAEAMTLKVAAAGLGLGGGWSIMIGDPARDKDEGLLRAHGRALAAFEGRSPTPDGRTPSRHGTALGSSHRKRRRRSHAMCWRPARWAAW
ncbi:Glu/Leu/Phe/Val dehydrogenase dimerization domain-containing protein [Streptomyces asiaticus]